MTVTEIAEYLDKVGLQYLATIGLDGKRRSPLENLTSLLRKLAFKPCEFLLAKTR